MILKNRKIDISMLAAGNIFKPAETSIFCFTFSFSFSYVDVKGILLNVKHVLVHKFCLS